VPTVYCAIAEFKMKMGIVLETTPEIET